MALLLRLAVLLSVIYLLASASSMGADALRNIRSEVDSDSDSDSDDGPSGREGLAVAEVPPPDAGPEVESAVVAKTLSGCVVQENCGADGEVLDTIGPTSKENCCVACQRNRACNVATFGGLFPICTLYGNSKDSALKIYEAPEGSPGLQCILK